LPLEEGADAALPKGMRKELTSLDEGQATLIWPNELSPESVEDLEHWLNGILRKAQRRAGLDRPENMSAGAYRLLRVLKLNNVAKVYEEEGAQELISSGLAEIRDGHLSITAKGQAVPRMLKKSL
jgi:hypothetical protein